MVGMPWEVAGRANAFATVVRQEVLKMCHSLRLVEVGRHSKASGVDVVGSSPAPLALVGWLTIEVRVVLDSIARLSQLWKLDVRFAQAMTTLFPQAAVC
jgi:hypothetical protein